jgi:hypothetical protein
MAQGKEKAVAWFMFIVLLASTFSVIFVAVGKAQGSSSKVVGLWHMDEVAPSGYNEITPDATGMNPGTLVHAPAYPALVDGEFGKALRFDGQNGVYVPIRFIVGFPPTPQPIYIPISTSLDVQEEVKVEAWINVQAFKDVTYNNIVVKCSRTDASSENTTRVFGLAVKAGIPQKRMGSTKS